jgi:cbb3-type cytochrome oxidase subunit 3
MKKEKVDIEREKNFLEDEDAEKSKSRPGVSS